MAVDIDKLLRRRLYLQRYVTALVKDVDDLIGPWDTELLALLSEFINDADERALSAFSRQRMNEPDAASALSGMLTIVDNQRQLVSGFMLDEMRLLLDQEVVVVAEAIDAEPPTTDDLIDRPVAGQARDAIILAAMTLYSTRLVADVTQAAATAPENIQRLVKGTRAEDRRNGILFWRNNVLRRELDMIVNGTASNADEHVYESAGIGQVDHLATLDFRVCPTCRVYEQDGPYVTGQQPRIPVHRFCRCVTVPHVPDGSYVRPFVRDNRSVKDIPKDERAGKIGTTRDTIEQFFNRMTDKDREAYMGPARAQLWKDGKISDIKQLVDEVTGEPLRLDQLPT